MHLPGQRLSAVACNEDVQFRTAGWPRLLSTFASSSTTSGRAWDRDPLHYDLEGSDSSGQLPNDTWETGAGPILVSADFRLVWRQLTSKLEMLQSYAHTQRASLLSLFPVPILRSL